MFAHEPELCTGTIAVVPSSATSTKVGSGERAAMATLDKGVVNIDHKLILVKSLCKVVSSGHLYSERELTLAATGLFDRLLKWPKAFSVIQCQTSIRSQWACRKTTLRQRSEDHSRRG